MSSWIKWSFAADARPTQRPMEFEMKFREVHYVVVVLDGYCERHPMGYVVRWANHRVSADESMFGR